MSAVHVNCLPLEVLTQIFEYLPLSDRKCVRLTCSRWYNACNQVSILKTEKLVLNWSYKERFTNRFFHAIIETFMKCNYKYLSFKFKNAEPIQHMSSFWEKCGPKIHYLCFKNCTIYQGEIKNLIMHCSNLECLLFKKCQLHITPDLFRNIVTSNVRRENLVSLEIISSRFQSWNMSHYIFNRICMIYPNIKSITLTDVDVDFNENVDMKYHPSLRITKETFIDSKNVFTFHCVFNKILSSSKVFEELSLNDVIGFTDTWLLNLASIPDLRLKRICIKKNTGITSSAFMKFCSKQPYLEYVDVSNCEWLTVECLKHLLKQCTNLLVLKMNSSRITLNYETMKLLVSSHLKKLEVNYCLKIDIDDINSNPNVEQLVNYNLRFLSFQSSLKESENLFILKTFRKLAYYGPEYISYNMTNAILQTICKYQCEIEQLKVNGDVTDYGFIGLNSKSIEDCDKMSDNFKSINNVSKFSIGRLKHLQKLELWNCRKITDDTILELVFPNLRHLSLKRCKKITDRGYFSICANNPSLEFLCLENMIISFDSLMLFVRGMKRLQKLSIVKCLHLSEEKLQIILLCSHLFFRDLVYRYGWNAKEYLHIEYHYNVFKKKWKKTIDET